MREHFRKRITELWDYPKISIPVRAGGRYFYVKNSGLQRQSPLYTRPNLTAPAALVLDPNVLSPDGSLSLAQWAPSHDGRLLAYGLSEGGADWRTLHVRDIDSGKDLPDEVRWMRFSDISWTNDGKGFFYSRFPEPPKGKALEAALSGQTVYYHRIGTPQAQDRLIYKREDLPTWFVGGKVTEDGRYLIVSIQKGSDNNNRVYYADLGDPMRPAIGAPIRPVIEDDDAEFAVFGNAGHVLYLRTDRASSNRKVIAVDLACPAQANWKTIIPEREQAIESVPLIGGRIVAQYLMDVQSRVSLFGLDGSAQGDLPLPGTGTVAGIGAVKTRRRYSTRSARRCLRRRYSSTIRDRNRRLPFEAAKPPVDVAQYETNALFATSKDGTRVPFFLTWRKDLALDGSHPAMIFWVTANMRGGAEYGEAWHKAGNLGNKQNVFDDFIAVAEYLVKEKYTSPGKLAIMGASNGGLLIGAVEEQRPDLYGVALPAVGVMDMLRYDKFTGGRAWTTEYGSSSNAAPLP